MAYHCHAPLDPSCPVIEGYYKEQNEHPMFAPMEIDEDWSKEHVRKCKRCQEFGAANSNKEMADIDQPDRNVSQWNANWPPFQF